MQEIWKKQREFALEDDVIMHVRMGTEVRLHRHLWHFQTWQCLIFFINIHVTASYFTFSSMYIQRKREK